jgi:hypothetical protein
MTDALQLEKREGVLLCLGESFKYQKVIKLFMASSETITFKKVKTYTTPEDVWNSPQDWYSDFNKRITGYNSLGDSKTIKVNSTYNFQSPEITKAMELRINNKDVTTGLYGGGKIMKQIIGEYVIKLEDKLGLQKKYSIMEEMLGIFNGDEMLTSEDPQGPKELINENFAELQGDDAITIALATMAVEDPNKITIGKAMGYLNGNFPHIRPNMKQLAGKVAKGVAIINQRVRDGELELIKEEAEAIYPSLFSDKSTPNSGDDESIFYQFKSGDLLPEYVNYQVGEEVREIELTKLIRRMKHDKSAYAWLNQHKPIGGPQWPQGGSGEYYLVISNDPFANFTKSSGRFWEQGSCERYNSYKASYSRGPITDMKYGNCAVFAFKGGELPKGWPEVQPTNKPSGNIINDPDGTLLGRQNIKWGYKENDESEVGMGLDPYFYPRSGAATWSKLLNKALAMIVNSLGYLDYTLLQTPYNYIGHCDVGIGTGILQYKSGTTCYTKIDENQANPDLLMASNEMIGFVAFDRLSRPIVDLNIKMILAQNPNIWAIAGNEVGIGRLIRTKDPDILRFLISSPNIDTEALSGIVDILPDISNDWFKASNHSSLAYLIAQHPNANDEIYRKLITKFNESNKKSIEELRLTEFYTGLNYGAMVLFGGIVAADSNTPYICMGGAEIINLLLDTLKSATPDQLVSITTALLFAPQLTNKQLIRLIPYVSQSLASVNGEASNNLAKRFMYAYILPMNSRGSWAFDDFQDFSLSKYNRFEFVTSRQTTQLLQALKPHLYSNEIFTETSKGSKSMRDIVISNTRDKKCFDWIWRRRNGLGVEPEVLLRFPYGVKDMERPHTQAYFESKQFMTCIGEGDLWKIRYDFESPSGEKRLRIKYPKEFVSAIISDVEMIQKLGWGVVAGWLTEEKQFYQYVDLVYKQAFKNLYLGRGRFAPPPKDIFELYNSVENIEVLNEAAIDLLFNEGGLCRNPQLPSEIQSLLLDKWLSLSTTYEGSYSEYFGGIMAELSSNINLNPSLLSKLSNNFGHEVASNPNAYAKTLMNLYNQYPSEVMANASLSNNAYARLWNNTWKVLNIQLLENPNRLFDNFRRDAPDVLEAHKGTTIRNSIIKFIGDNSYAKFWRAGTIKKGKFSQLNAKNLYTDPIADYPITPQGKVMVIKFFEHADEHFKNELWTLDTLKTIDDKTVFVEGVKNYWDGNKRTSIHVAENFTMNDFFNYIPESKREVDIVEVEATGGEKIIKASRWGIDNIVVIQDMEVQTKGAQIPAWRFDITQEKVNDILISYLERGMDITKLIGDLETYRNMKNYELSLTQFFEAIDAKDLWTVDLINNNLSYLMRSGGAKFINLKNIRPTEMILNLSISHNLEEIKEFEIYDVGLTDLPAIQEKILGFENIPISYVYYILTNSVNGAVIRKAREIRGQRSNEFIEYYRLQNPAPDRIK